MSRQTTAVTEQSPRIGALAGELARGNIGALAAFWDEVQTSGTPLVEAYDPQTRQCLVTWVWRGVTADAGADADVTHRVELEHALHLPDEMETHLQRLGETDLWFRTWRLRSDVRTSYAFTVNGSDMRRRPKPGDERTDFADPFNPDHHAQGTDLPGVWGGEEADRSSTLVLPDAEQLPWLDARRAMPAGEVTQHTLRSEILNNERQVWVFTPAGTDDASEPANLLVILDGERCLQPMGVPMLLDALQEAGKIGPTVAVMVGNVERGTELPCHQPFADFIAQELLPWVRERHRVTTDPQRTVISGLSYGGLASAFIGLRCSHLFGNVLSQSGSYWWKPQDDPAGERWLDPIRHAVQPQGWLTQEYLRAPLLPLRWYMDTGIFESQASNILPTTLNAANQHLRDVLLLKGYDVHYREYVGGHDYAWWRGTLADGLIVLLGCSARDGNGDASAG